MLRFHSVWTTFRLTDVGPLNPNKNLDTKQALQLRHIAH
jgi:hypothetical protein